MFYLTKKVSINNCFFKDVWYSGKHDVLVGGGSFMWYPTKRGKELYEKRDIQYLMNNVAWGDSFAMEAIGVDYLCRINRKTDENIDSSDDDIDIIDGIFLAIYWFDKSIEAGKIDTNYWIGETIDFQARICGSSGAYYRSSFLEHLSKFQENPVFKEVMKSKSGCLYKIFRDKTILIIAP